MKRSLIHLALLAGLFSGTAMAQVQVGDNANAVDPKSTAVGDNATAFNNCVAVGENALAGAPGAFGDCTAIGADSEAALGSISFGTRAKVRGNGTIGIGNDVNVPAGAVAGTVVVGHNSMGDNATVLGSNSSVTGNPSNATEGAVGVGKNIVVQGAGAAAFGDGARATNVNHLGVSAATTALGAQSNADAEGCVALGSTSDCDGEANTVSLGNATLKRRVTNLADGVYDTDAASVGQLNTMAGAIGGGAGFVNGVFVPPTITLSSGNTHTNVTAAIYDIDGRLHTLEQNPGGGSQGPAGASAYQVAVSNGFTGTEADWLASLKGDKGDRGDAGPQGPAGATGQDGRDGSDGRDGVDGPQGPAGQDGRDGTDGQDGRDGAGHELHAGSNVEVATNDDGSQTVSLSDNVALSNQGSVTVGDTRIDNSGLRIQGGPSVTANGIHAGNQRVTGVADGRVVAGSTDAINGGQLWNLQQSLDDRWVEIDRRFDRTDKRINGLGAQTAAMSQMAAAGGPYGLAIGEVAFNAGLGFYGNEAAIAVGWSTRVTERVNVSAGLSFGSGETKPMGGVGISIRLGR